MKLLRRVADALDLLADVLRPALRAAVLLLPVTLTHVITYHF